MTNAWILSSDHQPDGVSRLLPDRDGLSSAGPKNNGVPVGPGRGSGAGSLVAYALKITDLDPLPYDLLFERFLNPERVSMPDFDVDFCMDGRDRVIEYVANNYGREAVSQIITFRHHGRQGGGA
jgi:DNA polymerase III alpha subunit